MVTDPRLEVRKFAEGDDERGIYTTSTIPVNSTLAVAPLTSLLTTDHASNVPVLSSIAHLLREDDLLVLIMVYEQHLGVEAKWARHLTLLPKQYHSIINYTKEELELIRGSNLYIIATQWQKQVCDDYRALINILQTHSIQAHPAYTQFTYTTYLWCLSTIWSRFITITVGDKQYRAMVPFVDFLNHSATSRVGHMVKSTVTTNTTSIAPNSSHTNTGTSQTHVDTSNSGNINNMAVTSNVVRQTESCLHNHRFLLFSQQGFNAHEEVFLNYGVMGNMRSMMLYGFALRENDQDGVEVSLTGCE